MYDESSVKVLEGLEPVRVRPGMYIGDTGTLGFHHLVWEIIDNSVDEAMNGHANRIEVTMLGPRTIRVTDNGRGIPTGIHPTYGRSSLEIILTKLHSGTKFDGASYKRSGGLHGVGSSVVNALSSNMEAVIRRDGHKYRQTYSKGVPTSECEVVGESKRHGTSITFTPDTEIFGDKLEFSEETIRDKLEILAHIHKRIRFLFTGLDGQVTEYYTENGLRDFFSVVLSRTGRKLIHGDVFSFEKDGIDIGKPGSEIKVDVVLGWTDSNREASTSIANGIRTSLGGTHEIGCRNAILKAVRSVFDTHGLIPKNLTITPDDIRDGVLVLTSVFLSDPQFQSQTKDRLNNPEVQAPIEQAIRQALESWLNSNRTIADLIAAKVIQSARARIAAKEAEEDVKRKVPVKRTSLPGKLADCSTNDAQRAELFIVEGDSAGGSAKQARDRDYQAILPLRGKILNTEGVSTRKILENKEIHNIVAALGCGIGKDFNMDNLRYHKIILLMDADMDGHHISTLMLTFFYRHMPELIRQGKVFIACPPLYRISVGTKVYWAADDEAKERILRNIPRGNPEITRFKGLGEMPPKTLGETTLSPTNRTLVQVSILDGEAASTEITISEMMGDDPEPRFREITNWAGGDLDV